MDCWERYNRFVERYGVRAQCSEADCAARNIAMGLFGVAWAWFGWRHNPANHMPTRAIKALTQAGVWEER